MSIENVADVSVRVRSRISSRNIFFMFVLVGNSI